MTDVLTVTVNPVIDIHYFTGEFQAGRDNVVSCRKMFAAGKGMNVSRALQTFGISAEAFLLLGRENADEYLRLASGYGVKVSRILTDGSVRENISVNTPAGETRICTNDFSASPAALRELAELAARRMHAGTTVVFSGSLPNGIPQKEFADFVLSFRQAAPDCKILLDCPSLTLDTIAAIAPYLIKPNRREALALLGSFCRDGSPYPAAEETAAQAERLRARGKCAHVVISCGAAGAAYASSGGVSGFLAAPDPGPICTTVGAGDSMLAGILYGFAQKNAPDLPYALSWGVAFGSAACLTKGTCPPEKEAVFRFMQLIQQR